MLERYAAVDTDGYLSPTRDWNISPILRRRLDIAWRTIQAGDLANAAFLLNNTVDLYPDCADAWYMLALTTDDRQQKMQYLERALAEQPYHEYAWRDKGILEGVLPAAPPPDVVDPAPGEPVPAQAKTEVCPQCNGALVFNVAAGVLICQNCGYRPGMVLGAGGGVAARFSDGYDNLDNALLQRRFGFSKEWKIGARVLVCKNCHAQLTLTDDTLSAQCPFCDSAHILVEDAVGSFEEPDALLPFKIDRPAAAKALHQRLPPDRRAQVERGEMQGVYLPYWSFTGAASVMIAWDVLPAVARRLMPTATHHLLPGVFPTKEVLVGGVIRPAQSVLYELMPYDERDLIAYDTRYLAHWAAQIYTVDVIQASLTARAYIKYAARQQAIRQRVPEVDLARTDSDAYNVPNSPLWQAVKVDIETILYRLLLLPVWMITLVLRDGTRRPAVVNGQTGEAILSDSFACPERIIVGPNRPPIAPLPIVPSAPLSRVIRPLPPREGVIKPLPPRSSVIRPLPPRSSVIRPLKRRG
jgi:hypothetical protein